MSIPSVHLVLWDVSPLAWLVSGFTAGSAGYWGRSA
ncbi:hypothetical protein GGQ61_003757 [Phenylobacterium haematophilum]|jgi:hypothetical protein|uniref:Uncharacterized protein n=1 Tax=Phenylobacterium haematophilum TaxID=98513 RepID=A0A840A4V1_9CAUL|nr:hypothetical protein [Phenylobacterium haematophilum]